MSTTQALPQQPTIGEQFASGAAGFARINTTIGAWIATIVCTFLIGLGIYMIVKKNAFMHMDKVQGTITDINGTILSVSYVYNNVQYTNVRVSEVSTASNSFSLFNAKNKSSNSTPSTPPSPPPPPPPPPSYHVGDKVDLYVNPWQPKVAVLSSNYSSASDEDANRKTGYILIAVALIVLIFSWILKYFVGKNKTFATYVGATEGLQMLGGARGGYF